MQNRGKWLILFIFGTALAMALFAWTFQYLRGRRVLALYGPVAARLIRVDADRVELLLLARPPRGMVLEGAPHLQIGDEPVLISNTLDITRARGLIHARQALIEDSSYDWERPPADAAAQWGYAMRFSRGDRQVTSAIDSGVRQLRLIETGATAALAEHFVLGMQAFVDEQTAETQEAHAPRSPERSNSGR